MTERILADLYRDIVDTFGTFLQLSNSQNMWFNMFESQALNGGDLNERILLSIHAPTEQEFVYQADIPLAMIIKNASSEGTSTIVLQRMTLITMYSLWETHHRPTIARSLSLNLEEVKSDAFGDLRIIRNCIAHRNAVLDKHLKVFSHLFMAGAEIKLSGAAVHAIFSELTSDVNPIGKRAVCNGENLQSG